MNLDLFLKIGSTAAIILSSALNVYLFFRNRSDERFDRINEQAGRIAQKLQDEIQERRAESAILGRDHAVLAATVAGLPTHDDLSEIRDELSSMGRTMSSVDERSVSTLNSVRRIESYLMERKP